MNQCKLHPIWITTSKRRVQKKLIEHVLTELCILLGIPHLPENHRDADREYNSFNLHADRELQKSECKQYEAIKLGKVAQN
jgi:hypothetical protein